jgi:hypothetical protein
MISWNYFVEEAIWGKRIAKLSSGMRVENTVSREVLSNSTFPQMQESKLLMSFYTLRSCTLKSGLVFAGISHQEFKYFSGKQNSITNFYFVISKKQIAARTRKSIFRTPEKTSEARTGKLNLTFFPAHSLSILPDLCRKEDKRTSWD